MCRTIPSRVCYNTGVRAPLPTFLIQWVLWTECLCPSTIRLLKSQRDDIHKWDLWVVIRSREWALVNGISALRVRGSRALSASLPSLLSTLSGHQEKMAMCKPGGELASDTRSVDASIWDFQASRTVRTKFLVLKPATLQYSVTTA